MITKWQQFNEGKKKDKNKSYKQNESADKIIKVIDGLEQEVRYTMDDTYPFVYSIPLKDIHFGDCGDAHGDVYSRISIFDKEVLKDPVIQGRIWTEHKIIAFWKFDFSDLKIEERGTKSYETISGDNPLTFKQTLQFIEEKFNDCYQPFRLITNEEKDKNTFGYNVKYRNWLYSRDAEHTEKLDQKIHIDKSWLIDVPGIWFSEQGGENYQAYGRNYSLIPIDDFIKFAIKGIDTETIEMAKAIHLLSYAEKQEMKKNGWGKGWGSDMTAWDSKNPLAWRQAKYQESKSFEAADTLKFKDKYLNYTDKLTYPFSCKGVFDKSNKQEFNFGAESLTHSTCDSYGEPRGRIWLEHKVIAFWSLKTDNFTTTLKKIQKAFNKTYGGKIYNYETNEKIPKINLLDGSWFIELNEYSVKGLFNDERYSNYETYVLDRMFRNGDKGKVLPLLDFLKINGEAVELKKDVESEVIHLLSWAQKQELKKKGWGKGWGSDMTAWDSKNPLAWRQAKYQESLNIISDFKVFEWGDSITFNTNNAVQPFYVGLSTGRPFAYNQTTGEIFIGDEGNTHSDYNLEHPCNDKDTEWYWHGRLWENDKMITFWYYPEPDKFKELIDLIAEKLDIPMWNNGWQVQVYEKNNEVIYGDCEEDCEFSDVDTTLIPIEKYVGSKDAPEKERAIHLLSYAEKQEMKKNGWGKGWGSDMTAWDSKNPLAWRQAKYQESVKFHNK